MGSEMEKELEALRNTNTFNNKLFAIIGHDLKAPLNNIKGTIQLLQGDSMSAAQREEIIVLLSAAVDTSIQMLDNLLEWGSQKYYGEVLNVKTKEEPLSLYEQVNRAASFLQHHAVKKGIGIRNTVPLDLLVTTDLQQLLFVLRNLLSNAVKFSYEKTDVIIGASINDEGMVEVAVIDKGIGMPPERMQSLFQIDRRQSQEGTGNEKGAGLALILCKEFVENNGGKIWVEDNEECGTKFRFTAKLANIGI